MLATAQDTTNIAARGNDFAFVVAIKDRVATVRSSHDTSQRGHTGNHALVHTVTNHTAVVDSDTCHIVLLGIGANESVVHAIFYQCALFYVVGDTSDVVALSIHDTVVLTVHYRTASLHIAYDTSSRAACRVDVGIVVAVVNLTVNLAGDTSVFAITSDGTTLEDKVVNSALRTYVAEQSTVAFSLCHHVVDVEELLAIAIKVGIEAASVHTHAIVSGGAEVNVVEHLEVAAVEWISLGVGELSQLEHIVLGLDLEWVVGCTFTLKHVRHSAERDALGVVAHSSGQHVAERSGVGGEGHLQCAIGCGEVLAIGESPLQVVGLVELSVGIYVVGILSVGECYHHLTVGDGCWLVLERLDYRVESCGPVVAVGIEAFKSLATGEHACVHSLCTWHGRTCCGTVVTDLTVVVVVAHIV